MNIGYIYSNPYVYQHRSGVAVAQLTVLDEVDLAELRRTIEYACNTDRVALDFDDEWVSNGQRTVVFTAVKQITVGFDIDEHGWYPDTEHRNEQIEITLPASATAQDFAKQFQSYTLRMS